MTKAAEAQNDPFLALLEWRNTPSQQLGYSPAQILFGRRTRTRLPSTPQLLATPESPAVKRSLERAKERQAQYYNVGAKERPPLTKGQTVRVKLANNAEWAKGKIDRVLPYRSYEVRLADGTTRRRTSKHVRFSSEPSFIPFDDDVPGETIPTPASPAPEGTVTDRPMLALPIDSRALTITRSGRQVIRPTRYRDYND